MISVIVPAYNEEASIERCLSGLLAGSEPGELEVIVACNGCSDRTAEIARGIGEPVRVVETSEASKVAALNLGDSAATGYPRFYVDADVDLCIEAIRAVASALITGEIFAAAPRLEVNLDGASWPVRCFYDVWRNTPYHRHGMIGSGVFALSREGRARFGAFPKIIADDGYVRAHFTPGERAVLQDYCFTIRAPKTLRDLVKVKTRSRLGNFEIRNKYPDLDVYRHVGGMKYWGKMLARPAWWLKIGIYGLVVVISIWRAKRQLKSLDGYVWERDESSRSREKHLNS